MCLCGRNAELREQLEHDFAGDARVRVEPFTDEMPDWLAAADALVHSTGGLTVLEAMMRGCPAISYGWGRGHVRAHNRAFVRFGLAQVATTPGALRSAVSTRTRAGATSQSTSRASRQPPRSSWRRPTGPTLRARSVRSRARPRAPPPGARRPPRPSSRRSRASSASRSASPRGIALTFDDGPHPAGTPDVLGQLERAGAKGTFYLVGEQVERNPSLAAEIAAAGHEVGIHGYRHTLLLRRSPAALRDDFDRAEAVIGEATGAKSLSYRPPYGVFSLAGPAPRP